MRLIKAGVRPARLESPKMEDDTWELILKCWKFKPSERPAMEQIVRAIDSDPLVAFPSLTTMFNQVYNCIVLSRRCTMTDTS